MSPPTPAPATWQADGSLTVEGVPYGVLGAPAAGAGALLIFKPRIAVECYEPVIEEFVGATIVELGIYAGGSTAYLAQRCRPRRLLAVERSVERAPALDAFVADHGLEDVVRCRYGLDQGDRAGLGAAVAEELGGAPIDLVIDDASHRYEPTVASFEVLFPRLRPGGLYLVEDWASDDWLLATLRLALAADDPMARAVVETRLRDDLAESSPLGAAFRRLLHRSLADASHPWHGVLAPWYEHLGRAGADERSADLRARLDAVDPAEVDGVEPPSLGTLGLQLLLAVKSLRPVVRELVVTPFWLAVRRGDGELGHAVDLGAPEVDPFRVASSLPPRMGRR